MDSGLHLQWQLPSFYGQSNWQLVQRRNSAFGRFTMLLNQLPRRPRVVAMGSKEYRVDDYVAEYEKDFDFAVCPGALR